MHIFQQFMKLWQDLANINIAEVILYQLFYIY